VGIPTEPAKSSGFGLCHARNLGLSAASGELVSYLVDDNAIAPEFIAQTKQFSQSNPTVKCSNIGGGMW